MSCLGPPICEDCGVNIRTAREMYMVRNRLWEDVVGWRDCTDTEVIGPGRIYLCIGCLEQRMGRLLTADDFLSCPLNEIDDYPKSERLIDRLTSHGLRSRPAVA